MRAAIYTRVSTTQQVDRDSLGTQEQRLRQYCQAHGYQVYRNKPYQDEGVSAKDTNRPGFEQLMRDIQAGNIQLVIVTRLDRITRSLKDLIQLMEFLHEHDARLVSLTENIDTTGPMGRFVLNLLGSIAQLEREIDSERVSADMHHRASTGKWTGGVVPLGYTSKGKLLRQFLAAGTDEDQALKRANKIAPVKGRLYVVEEDAQLVRTIYEDYLRFRSLRRVTHRLNTAGIRPPQGTSWAPTSIRRILTNPTYIGKVWYGKRKTDLATGKLKQVDPELWKVVKGEHEPIIPLDLYQKVQKLLKQRYMKPSKAKKIYLLTGLLRCGSCKGSMYGYVYRKRTPTKQKDYFYYRCRNSLQKGRAVCKGLLVPGGIIEKTITDTLLALSKNERFLSDKKLMLEALREQATPPRRNLGQQRNKLTENEKRLVEIRATLLEKLERKVIGDSVFVERFDGNKKKLEAVRDQIAGLASQGEQIDLRELALTTTYEELCNLPQIWSDFTDEEKQQKLRTMINQVVVTRDKNANTLELKLELFLDTASSRKPGKFRSVAFPYRRGTGSSLPQA